MDWRVLVALLCVYGFLKECRFTEPYLVNFLVSDKNLTADAVNAEVLPYWTYSFTVLLIPVFILTDLLRYKPVVLLESLFYGVTWVLLTWGRGLTTQQLMQVAYGSAAAFEIAYYAYLYASIDASKYQRVTSYTRASLQFGKCLSYTASQLIISQGWGHYDVLNYATLGSLAGSFCTAMALPWVEFWAKSIRTELRGITWKKYGSLYVSGEIDGGIAEKGGHSTRETYQKYVMQYFRTLFATFRLTYSSAFVCKWSLWWALGTCGFYQVGNYIQSLWGSLQEEQGLTDEEIYNGIVESVNTGLGSLALLSLQFVHVDWKRWGELCLAIVSIVDCALLVSMSYVKVLFVQYAFYILFRLSYQIVITIAQYNLALKMRSKSYGLVFGFNTFIALALQTLLTFVVADKGGLNLAIRPQFLVYGCYYGIMAAAFLLMGVWTIARSVYRRSQQCE